MYSRHYQLTATLELDNTIALGATKDANELAAIILDNASRRTLIAIADVPSSHLASYFQFVGDNMLRISYDSSAPYRSSAAFYGLLAYLSPYMAGDYMTVLETLYDQSHGFSAMCYLVDKCGEIHKTHKLLEGLAKEQAFRQLVTTGQLPDLHD